MNIRRIVTYNNLRKQFTAEELAFADALYAASDTERELLVESLQPERSSGKKKAKKPASGGGSSSGKSTRASNMAATLGKNRQPQEPRCVACYEVLDHANHGTGEGQHQFETSLAARANAVLDRHNAKCVFEADGKVCHGFEDDSIHDPTMGYGGYHEFQPEQAQAAGGD